MRAFTQLQKTQVTFLVALVLSTTALADTWSVTPLIQDLDTAEGPVWDEEGILFFTEIFAHQVHAYTIASGTSRPIRKDSGGSNGMAFDSQKRLLMCEMLGKRLVRREHDGTIVPLWEAEHEGRGGPNDVVVSSNGNAYFTMPKHKTVYRMNRHEKVEAFITDLAGINGVKLSLNETTLYVTEYKNRKVHAYPINENMGTVGSGRLFAEIHTEGTEHGADGMAIDDQDRLYVCCLGGIWVFNTKGQQVDFISLPDEKVTNCAFAGKDDNTLYITTQQGLFVAKR
jgi:gluconolactonase